MTTETAGTAGAPGKPGGTRQPDGKRKGRKGEPQPALGWRIFGLLLGLVLALVGLGAVAFNAVQGVQATGFVGTRGTLTVEDCVDRDLSRKNSDYECTGHFVPSGDGYEGWGTLENAADYPEGEKLHVAENLLGERAYRETGVGATLLSVMWLCFGLVTLLFGVVQTRKWARSLRPARRQ